MSDVVASYIQQVGVIEPYVTVEEVKFSPIASAIDLDNLVDGGPVEQDRALWELILGASSEVDTFCMGALGTLNAMSNTEASSDNQVNREGYIVVHPSYWPIIAVSNFSWSPIQGNLQTIPNDKYHIFVDRAQIKAKVSGAYGNAVYAGFNVIGDLLANGPQAAFCEYTYVNGWPNTFLSVAATAGNETITVVSTVGVYANFSMTIWDGTLSESHVVSSVDTDASTVTFTTPLRHQHGVGVNFSSLPRVVKDAAIHFLVAKIQQRGDGGVTLQSDGTLSASAEGSSSSGVAFHLAKAYDLLDQFKSHWGRV